MTKPRRAPPTPSVALTHVVRQLEVAVATAAAAVHAVAAATHSTAQSDVLSAQVRRVDGWRGTHATVDGCPV